MDKNVPDMDDDKRLVRSKSGLRIVSKNEGMFFISEPAWIPDSQAKNCMQCSKKFSVAHRRHHCRRCGRLLCSSCCEHKVALHRMHFVDPVRHCVTCYPITKVENEFFEKFTKLLTNGAEFAVTDSAVDAPNPFDETAPKEAAGSDVHKCAFSSDLQSLTFSSNNPFAELQPVELNSLKSFQFSAAQSEDGTPYADAVRLVCRCTGQSRFVRLKITAVPNRRQSMTWLVGLQKGLKMIQETKSPATTPE